MTVDSQWRELSAKSLVLKGLPSPLCIGGPAGIPLRFSLADKDLDQLQGAASELKYEIATYPGTIDISDNFKPGKHGD